MSIVSSAATPQQFSYPHTSIGGWLCASMATDVQPNNSTPQGQLFYQVLNGTSYTQNAIDACPTAEGVYQQGATFTYGGTAGLNAIESDMEAACHHQQH